MKQRPLRIEDVCLFTSKHSRTLLPLFNVKGVTQSLADNVVILLITIHFSPRLTCANKHFIVMTSSDPHEHCRLGTDCVTEAGSTQSLALTPEQCGVEPASGPDAQPLESLALQNPFHLRN